MGSACLCWHRRSHFPFGGDGSSYLHWRRRRPSALSMPFGARCGMMQSPLLCIPNTCMHTHIHACTDTYMHARTHLNTYGHDAQPWRNACMAHRMNATAVLRCSVSMHCHGHVYNRIRTHTVWPEQGVRAQHHVLRQRLKKGFCYLSFTVSRCLSRLCILLSHSVDRNKNI